MNESIVVCGREFRAEVVEHLNQLARQQPPPTGNTIAREACALLAWYGPDGRPALPSAKVALRKLQKRGLLMLRPARTKARHRLRASGQPLPPVEGVPRRVDQVRGLRLHLLSGQQDGLHGLWNDLIIAQHPCGSAPLVGAQLRYLIGSDHGWLGALGFGPAAFALASRDQWIGWSTPARLGHLRQVVGLARLLIRNEVHCTNLVSKILSLALARLPEDWLARYGVRPQLVETYVDRSRFTGRSFSAANWLRVGVSSGRGRLGPKTPVKSLKDIWIFPLEGRARQKLQTEVPPPLTPQRLDTASRRTTGALTRWRNWTWAMSAGKSAPSRSLKHAGSSRKPVSTAVSVPWSPAKAAYGFIEHRSAEISLERLLSSHQETTQARMAAEELVLLPQDTTGLNYTGLRQTSGLGPLGEQKGRGLWLHTLLAFRPDGVPLGVLDARCWARSPEESDARGRNAKSIDEKESFRWIEAFQRAGAAAQRMLQTQLVVITDREGDLYELHDAAQIGPANLHVLIRAQHDRKLECHQKLWAFMESQPVGQTRELQLPRRRGQPPRRAQVQVRWASAIIEAPAVGCKKSWPPLTLRALWVHEPNPAGGSRAH